MHANFNCFKTKALPGEREELVFTLLKTEAFLSLLNTPRLQSKGYKNSEKIDSINTILLFQDIHI